MLFLICYVTGTFQLMYFRFLLMFYLTIQMYVIFILLCNRNISIYVFQISFEVILNGTMDFSRCKTFSIRGYDQVKLSSIISTEIKDCKAFNPILINPNIVIDAVGPPDELGMLKFFHRYFVFTLLTVHSFYVKNIDY